MSEEVKAALRAASRELCDFMTGGGCECLAGTMKRPCASHHAAAGIVAAFLRAVPAGLPTADSPCAFRFRDEGVRDRWAAAVEAAAHE